MTKVLYPLLFKSILKPTIWGGDKILSYKRRAIDNLSSDLSGENIGESWELSGVPEQESVVANGYLKGHSLRELINEFKGELVGEKNYARYGSNFPLLIKYIDAAYDLSIQLHPAEELARKRHNSSGKDEMWYLLQADKGASLIAGFQEGITKEKYHNALKNNSLPSVLKKYDVKPGDLFYLPSGCIHSIGAGSFILEIQQASDITYRLYDYNRVDKFGKQRQLHTELAEEAIDYNMKGNCKVERRESDGSLIKSKWFRVEALDVEASSLLYDYSEYDSFVAIVCVKGSSSLKYGVSKNSPTSGEIAIEQGDVLLLPSSLKRVIIDPGATGGARFITVRV